MLARFSGYTQYLTDTVLCPKCGNCGVIKWNYVHTHSGLKKDFVGIAGDFYERLSDKAPYPIEIVCCPCRVAVVATPPPPQPTVKRSAL